MKKSLLAFLSFFYVLFFAQTYQLTGNPINTTGWTLTNSATTVTDFVQLTADQTSQIGAIKVNNPINLKFCDKWKIEFDFRIDGNGTTQYGKGDGISFWYISNPPASFTGGGGLGLPTGAIGFMMGFDIFNNTTEAQMSKVHILYGVSAGNIEFNNTVGSTFHSPDLYTTIPFQNGSYRHVEVNAQVDPAVPANWIVQVKIDGNTIANQSFAPSGAAATMTQGYFGFSAATGGASARHSIKNVKIYVDKVPLNNTNVTGTAPCPDPTTGVSTVNLTTFANQFVTTPANYTFTYYVQGNTTPIANPSNYQYTGNPPVFSVIINDPSNVYCDNPDGTITLQSTPIPKTDATIYACKEDGNGVFNLTNANVTPSTTATKKYYPTLANLNAGTNEITTPAAYPSAGGEVYVKITDQNCFAIAKITLLFHPNPVVNDATVSSCPIPTQPTYSVFDLTTAAVTSVTPVTKKYFPTLGDIKNETNEIVNPKSYPSQTGFVYVKVFDTNGCYSVAKITLTVIPPKYSSVLKDKVICIEDLTTLDAGPGFTSYIWSTGATTSSIQNVGIGNYWVDLEIGGCTTRQFVKVTKTIDPVITNVSVSNSTATVHVQGGNPPYQYSLDGIKWQTSNVFVNLPRGQAKFYVKDSFDCIPISTEVTIPNLVNVITPNNDGYNDSLNYIELSYKKNLKMEVYDRYGNLIQIGDKKNGYRWDGRKQGKRVATGTYWYHISWNEDDNSLVEYSGWVLVKNRE